VVAKHWSAEYVWNAHHNAAVRLGIAPEVVESIRIGAVTPENASRCLQVKVC
jgi:hypothetical protein